MSPRSPAVDRFWPKVNMRGPVPEHRPDLGPCWLWTAAQDGKGYGAFCDGTLTTAGNKRVVKAYTWCWAQENGPVPNGLELDHLCRVKLCVRPSHLEPVTHGVNISRARKARTHCRRGHDLADAHIRARDGARLCRQCKVEDQAAYRERKKGAGK